jgi:hypothetical protein
MNGEIAITVIATGFPVMSTADALSGERSTSVHIYFYFSYLKSFNTLIPNLGGQNEEDPAVPVTTGQAVRAAAAAAAREVEVEVEIPKPVSQIVDHLLFIYLIIFVCLFFYKFSHFFI